MDATTPYDIGYLDGWRGDKRTSQYTGEDESQYQLGLKNGKQMRANQDKAALADFGISY